ncbi:MAG: helix-turn-helix domain-containing protein, partial [Desulfamplus sp.]|nr:helix-turn-helix domain-containing protein [Desulfamplus sp.]
NGKACPPPLENAEKRTIVNALELHDGHRALTAEYLGIDKSTLWRKMKKHQINIPVSFSADRIFSE